MKTVRKPEIEKWWTTVYYGERGSCKSLHQARTVVKILEYLVDLYANNRKLNKAIVYSVQRFSPAIDKKYKDLIYYWNDAKDLRYCPRKTCWKGKKKHRLHGCYLIFDDIATILPADNWVNTPIWLRKLFSQARHFGIRIIANLQDPFGVDINFRRYSDMYFQFRKVCGSPDPDETKEPVKRIWGVYTRRRITAKWLFKFGAMSDAEIAMQQQKMKRVVEMTGKGHRYKGLWKGSTHLIKRKHCEIYDTTQDVPEYKPTGYSHTELACTDPEHNHTDKKAPNYCGFRKVKHEIE